MSDAVVDSEGEEWTPSTPAEEMRMLHSWRESQVKALGRLVFLLGILSGLNLISYVIIGSLAAAGRVTAPWMFTNFFVIVLVLKGMFFVAALASGYCLYTLRGSSRVLGAVAVASMALLTVVLVASDIAKGFVWGATGGVLVSGIYFLPWTIFLQKKIDVVLSPAYRAAVRETPSLRVRPRMPWSIKLGMLALFTIGIVVGLIP